jgi:GTP-binding protein YchF
MKSALIGFVQSGKSTILSAISGKNLGAAGQGVVEEAVVPVPDDRIEWLNGHYKPKKKTPATIDVVDLPGFSLTEEHGRAAARKLMNQVRTVDMLVLVVRAFENPSVAPYKNSVDAKRDLVDLRTELLLADLELVTTRIERLEGQVKKPTKTQGQDRAELELQLRLQEALESEKPISTAIKTEAEKEMIKSLNFLTQKPMVVVVNVNDKDLGKDFKFELPAEVPVVNVCASIEKELTELDAASRKEFMADLGIAEPASKKFVTSCYSALGLISFLTAGEDEVRAWPIKKGTTALDAAGKIHSDIKRGFIRAETISFDDLKTFGDEKAVKAAGKMRLEGKAYIVQDGDIINFRFNV